MKPMLLFILSFFSLFLHAQKTIIYCGKMVDARNAKMLTEMSIVVDSGKITDVVKGYMQAASSGQNN